MPLTEPIFGAGARLRTEVQPRSIDRDIELLTSQYRREQAVQQALDAYALDASRVGFPEIAAGAGVLPNRISFAAQDLVGTPNSRYYSDTRVACASFVSTVLLGVGAFRQNHFTRYCPTLEQMLKATGAQQVLSRNTRIQAGVSTPLEPGDVILFHDAGTRFRHTGIYIGGGRFVGTSSSAGIVKNYVLSNYPSYDYIAVYRYP